MTFTSFLEMYEFFSTPQLLKVVTDSRNRFFDQLRRSLPGNRTRADMMNSYGSRSLIGLAIDTYWLTEQWEQIQEVSDDIASDPNAGQSYQSIGRKMQQFATDVEVTPLISEYFTMVRSLNSSFAEYKTKSFDDVARQALIYEIEAVMQEYADEVKKASERFDLDSYDYVQYHQNYIGETWNPQDGLFIKGTDKPLASADADAWNELISYLEDTDIPEQAVKFILNPTLGTVGIQTIGLTKSPLLLSAIPSDYLKVHAQAIWTSRNDMSFNLFDDEPARTGHDVEDPIQLRHEREFYENILYGDHSPLSDKKKKRGKDSRKGGDKGPFGFNFPPPQSGTRTPKPKGKEPETEGSSSKGKKAKKDQGDPDPNPSSSSQQPAVPDDDNYTPDGGLFILSKDWIKELKSLPADDMSHDHMTRFSTNQESARSLSIGEMRRGQGADWFIVRQNALGRQQYVVTFTRKSKKPIFNVVT